MENEVRDPNRSRNTWLIVIGVIAALLLVCLIIAIIVVLLTGALGFMTIRDSGIGPARVTEETQQVYQVEPGATLEVGNFAGNILVRSGPEGQIMLISRRRAAVAADLQRIQVDVRDEMDGLQIITSHPTGPTRNWSVEFEITVPPDTVLDLDTAAGNVDVQGIEGEIVARTGAGNITVRGATAAVALRTGAGNISYEGEPSDLCTFNTAAGNITLRLPQDAEVELDLSTSVGNIELGGFDVEGDIARTRVTGVIGTGEQATIEADASVGNVVLVAR